MGTAGPAPRGPSRAVERLRKDAGLDVEIKVDLDGKYTWRFSGKCGRVHDLDLPGMRALAAVVTEQIARVYEP